MNLELLANNLTVHTANGDAEGLGRVNVAISIGNINHISELLVIRNLSFPVILGLDLISVFRLTVHRERIYQGVDIDLTKDYRILNSSFEIQGEALSTLLVKNGVRPDMFQANIISQPIEPTSVGAALAGYHGALPVGESQPEASHGSTKRIRLDNACCSSNTCSMIDKLATSLRVICISEAVKEEISRICNPRLVDLLNKHLLVFSMGRFDIGQIKLEKCKIKTSSDAIINLRAFKCSKHDQDLINSQIDELIKHGLVRLSNSPYASPVTLVDKKDDGPKTRLVTDYRKINQITIPDNHPFPRVDDIVDKLYASKVFSVLDISSGFWHIAVADEDIEKTAFVTMENHYEWLVMPFKLRNAPAIFQRAVHRVLEKHQLTAFTHNYIDDIMIHSVDEDSHLKHLDLVFKALIEEGIKLKLSKCIFGAPKVKFLGHIISGEGISPLNSNTIAIRKFPIPSCKKDIQKFLGKITFYRKFIPFATKLLNPLYILLKQDVRFEWNDSCQEAFDKVKDILCKEPILKIHDPEKTCYLLTDASKLGIGAILKQEHESKMHPVGYFSKKLLNYQVNYTISELERLAIVESIDYFHHYLYDRKFIVITDQMALKWLKSIKRPNSRLFKWSLKLSQYNFDVKYRPGKDNIEADLLSRYPVLESFENTDYLRIVNLISTNDIINEQTSYFSANAMDDSGPHSGWIMVLHFVYDLALGRYLFLLL